MKRFNTLYVILLSFFVVFGAWGMDDPANAWLYESRIVPQEETMNLNVQPLEQSSLQQDLSASSLGGVVKPSTFTPSFSFALSGGGASDQPAKETYAPISDKNFIKFHRLVNEYQSNNSALSFNAGLNVLLHKVGITPSLKILKQNTNYTNNQISDMKNKANEAYFTKYPADLCKSLPFFLDDIEKHGTFAKRDTLLILELLSAEYPQENLSINAVRQTVEKHRVWDSYLTEQCLNALNQTCKFYPRKLFESAYFVLVNQLLPTLSKTDNTKNTREKIVHNINTMIECVEREKTPESYIIKLLLEAKEIIETNSVFDQNAIKNLNHKFSDINTLFNEPDTALGSSSLQHQIMTQKREQENLNNPINTIRSILESSWNREIKTYALQLMFWDAQKNEALKKKEKLELEIKIIQALKTLDAKAPKIVHQRGTKEHPIFTYEVKKLPQDAPLSLLSLFETFKKEEQTRQTDNQKLAIETYKKDIEEIQAVLKKNSVHIAMPDGTIITKNLSPEIRTKIELTLEKKQKELEALFVPQIERQPTNEPLVVQRTFAELGSSHDNFPVVIGRDLPAEIPQILSSHSSQPAVKRAEEKFFDEPIQLLPELQLKETPDVVNILSTINNLILKNSKIKGSDLVSNDAFTPANQTYKLLVKRDQEYDSAALTNLKQDIIKKIQNKLYLCEVIPFLLNQMSKENNPISIQLAKDDLLKCLNALPAEINNFKTMNMELIKKIFSQGPLDKAKIQACLILLASQCTFYKQLNAPFINELELIRISFYHTQMTDTADFVSELVQTINLLATLMPVLSKNLPSDITIDQLETYKAQLLTLEEGNLGKYKKFYLATRANAEDQIKLALKYVDEIIKQKKQTEKPQSLSQETPHQHIPLKVQIDARESNFNVLEEADFENPAKITWNRNFIKKLEAIKAEIPNKNIQELQDIIDNLKGHLALTSNIVLQITTQGKSEIYKNIIQTLYNSIHELAKKEKSLQKDAIPVDYFKNIATQIQLFEEAKLLEKDSDNLNSIKGIIDIYKDMLDMGTLQLKEEIREVESSQQKDRINSYLGNNDVLKPYLNKITNELLQERENPFPMINVEKASDVNQPPITQIQIEQTNPQLSTVVSTEKPVVIPTLPRQPEQPKPQEKPYISVQRKKEIKKPVKLPQEDEPEIQKQQVSKEILTQLSNNELVQDIIDLITPILSKEKDINNEDLDSILKYAERLIENQPTLENNTIIRTHFENVVDTILLLKKLQDVLPSSKDNYRKEINSKIQKLVNNINNRDKKELIKQIKQGQGHFADKEINTLIDFVSKNYFNSYANHHTQLLFQAKNDVIEAIGKMIFKEEEIKPDLLQQSQLDIKTSTSTQTSVEPKLPVKPAPQQLMPTPVGPKVQQPTPQLVTPAPEPKPTTGPLAPLTPKDFEKTGIEIIEEPITPPTVETQGFFSPLWNAFNYVRSTISSVWNYVWSALTYVP